MDKNCLVISVNILVKLFGLDESKLNRSFTVVNKFFELFELFIVVVVREIKRKTCKIE